MPGRVWNCNFHVALHGICMAFNKSEDFYVFSYGSAWYLPGFQLFEDFWVVFQVFSDGFAWYCVASNRFWRFVEVQGTHVGMRKRSWRVVEAYCLERPGGVWIRLAGLLEYLRAIFDPKIDYGFCRNQDVNSGDRLMCRFIFVRYPSGLGSAIIPLMR